MEEPNKIGSQVKKICSEVTFYYIFNTLLISIITEHQITCSTISF